MLAMIRCCLALAALLVLSGCATATLPYTPAQQPAGEPISASYQVLGDRLRIEIDSGGRRIEEVTILEPSGALLRATALDTPLPGPAGSPVGIGIGIGGGSFSTRGGVGVGTGLSVGVPVGGGSGVVEGNSFAWFPLAEAGPGPWRLYVKLAGLEPTLIFVGGPLPKE
jgi:hypothetical protein